jgi:hypothetical protein
VKYEVSNDTYNHTIKEKNHAHIILYKGIKIMGYAHNETDPQDISIGKFL